MWKHARGQPLALPVQRANWRKFEPHRLIKGTVVGEGNLLRTPYPAAELRTSASVNERPMLSRNWRQIEGGDLMGSGVQKLGGWRAISTFLLPGRPDVGRRTAAQMLPLRGPAQICARTRAIAGASIANQHPMDHDHWPQYACYIWTRSGHGQ